MEATRPKQKTEVDPHFDETLDRGLEWMEAYKELLAKYHKLTIRYWANEDI